MQKMCTAHAFCTGHLVRQTTFLLSSGESCAIVGFITFQAMLELCMLTGGSLERCGRQIGGTYVAPLTPLGLICSNNSITSFSLFTFGGNLS